MQAVQRRQMFGDEGASGAPSSRWLCYLIQFGLLAGEGEGEAHRKLFVFDVVFFHEVAQTLRHMFKQLEQSEKAEAVSRSARRGSCVWVSASTYFCAGAVNDVLRRVVDLTLHLDGLLLLVAHFDTEDPEVAASQIQSNKVPLF